MRPMVFSRLPCGTLEGWVLFGCRNNNAVFNALVFMLRVDR